jgi:predicted Zn-dependent peptidase
MPILTPPHHTTRLGNGLRVIAVDLPHLHTIHLAHYVRIGSRYESADRNGLSHFVEHMLYRGTISHPSSLELNFAFEKLGGGLHAETGRDDSLFQTTALPESADRALELLGELLSRPIFGDIERERALILEELNEDYDEDGNEVNGDDLGHALLFGDAGLGQRIIGPPQNVERFTDADVRAHFDAHYGAASGILCMAGPISDAHLRAAERHFGGLPQGARVEPREAPHVTGPHYRYVAESGSQSSLTILLRAIPERDPDYAAGAALVRALDDGMSTRLHYRLCDQLGLAYHLAAGIECYHDVSLLEVSGATAHRKVAPLLRGVLGLFDELRVTPITADELDKIKTRTRFDLAAAQDDPGAMAAWFGGTSLYFEPPALEARLAEIDALTTDDIQRAARRVLTPENLAVVIVGALSRARQGEVREIATGWTPPA